MRILVSPGKKGAVIDKNIYGHFSEHLGRCIYGGLFVGEDSAIPNIHGIRKDVLAALRAVRLPVLRWPGGCFASEYHWRDGVGEKSKRKVLINNFWGGVREDNSFGTHEFLELCELIGCEPYINMNVGSGTVQEMQEWVEYLTSDNVSPMADLRRENGRETPWRVPFIGIGNENWGGGGNMRAEYYADVYRRYQTYVRSHGENKVCKIACGAGCSMQSPGYDWTETLMRVAGRHMDGLSLHYYTLCGDSWDNKGSATEFSEADYYKTLKRALYMEELLCGHEAIMDRYDRERRVGLIVDEWGAWYDVEPGTNPGFLYQQNTLRDAQIAAVTLNILNNHAARVKMANIAQLVNVLQALVLTDGEKMLLTPTYHVFDLFKEHQNATLVAASVTDCGEESTADGALPMATVSASEQANGRLLVTLTNSHATRHADVRMRLDGGAYKAVSARVLAGEIHAMNTFDAPDAVASVAFDGVTCAPDALGTECAFTLPPCAVVAVTFEKA